MTVRRTRPDQEALRLHRSAGTRRLRCLADLACKRATYFQVRFDADAPKPVRREADVCADHLDGVVRYLNRWAAEGELTGGLVTILVLDTPAHV